MKRSDERNLRWASIDAAKNVSGVALWEGARLFKTQVVKGLGAEDWAQALDGCAGYVIEGGYVGASRSVGLVLAFARGRIDAIAELRCGAERWAELRAAEWRQQVGITARSRKQAKQAARAMCRWLMAPPAERRAAGSRWDLFHLEAMDGSETDDECEAVLIGLAYQALVERSS